ncbi:hypothetical protein GCM10011571_09690 [Marinithermofilum abyssi]|uniref:Uncharacterized protein n=1 Tax=Marinithermofilum abyssi TaxID=1571185 RepID=A0A8J2VFL2_9BACL|nr:hypothetical protein [Marinithermofilum abyssi]GGE10446.1 hypothetical protein GCM10011571_09690 [Marinithermofilum abyssi]
MHDGDIIVLFLLVGLFLYLMARQLSPKHAYPAIPMEEQGSISGEIPRLLEGEGYDVVASKQRLPISVRVGEDRYDSRLFVDYIAKLGTDYYCVIVAKARKPLRLSGSALRDQFLGHFLAFPCAGILYVDPMSNTVKRIVFDVEKVHFRTPRRRWFVTHLMMLGLGALIAALIK